MGRNRIAISTLSARIDPIGVEIDESRLRHIDLIVNCSILYVRTRADANLLEGDRRECRRSFNPISLSLNFYFKSKRIRCKQWYTLQSSSAIGSVGRNFRSSTLTATNENI